jgi:hypothetical protein
MATTDEGKRVILHKNGKWEYKNDDTAAVAVDIKCYTKPEAAKTLLKSEKTNFAIWFDSKKWKKSKDLDNEDAEFELELLNSDGYAVVITERIEVDIENFKEIALENARDAAPDIAIEKEENRIVNGQKIKFLQMGGSAMGIKLVYVGYYSSNESGTIQLICYTGKNLLKNYLKDFENLMNGLVVMDDGKKE